MKHKGCGGVVLPDYSKVYEHEGKRQPAQRCQRCCAEILNYTQVESEEQ